MTGIDDILERLLDATGASRVTLRQDVPGSYAFPVTHEALAAGVASLRGERTVDLRTQPVVLQLQTGRQVVQDDCRAAYDDPAFQRMLDAYGGLAAQIVTPVFDGDRLRAVVSLHQLGQPRRWAAEEVAAARAGRRPGGGAAVRIPATDAHNRWHPDLEPVATVRPGEEITLETRDGLDGQLTRDSSHADVLALDLGLGHPLTGPVYVEGAEPGDIVDVELLAYETADFGVTAVIPGFGFLADVFTDPFLVHWDIEDGCARSPELPGVDRPGDPFAGVIGVAPSHELMEEIALREQALADAGAPVADSCRKRRSLRQRARACARFRRGRSAATSTSASSSPARASRFRFTSRARSSRSEISTSPRATARSAAPASRSRAQ